MKKFLKVSLGILLAIALLCTYAFAEGSVTGLVEVTDANGDIVAASEVDESISAILDPGEGWIIVWIGDIDGLAPYTFNVLNYEGPIRVFHFVNNEWHMEGEGENPLTVNPESSSPFAVAIKRTTAPGPTTEPTPAETSPKTGETILPYAAIGVAMVAAAAAVVIRRKED